MPLFTALMVIILAASITICLITANRVFAYNKKYNLPELSYTKLFRILTKEYIMVLYIGFVIAHFIITIWFLFTL